MSAPQYPYPPNPPEQKSSVMTALAAGASFSLSATDDGKPFNAMKRAPDGLVPPLADAAARLEARVLEAAHAHGYERVDPPLAEFEDALAHRLKATRAQDAVRFVDPVSQRTLAIQIGRAHV